MIKIWDNKMDIEKWRSDIDICIENVKTLVEDGKSLMDKGSFGHATFLFLTAFEEIAIAYYIIQNFNEPKPNQLNKKEFLSHLKKYSFARFYTFLMSGDFSFFEEYFKIIKKMVESQKDGKNIPISEKKMIALEKNIQKIDDIWNLRNNSLYVSLDPIKLKYQTPKSIKKSIAQIIFYKINLIVLKLEIDRELIFKFGPSSLQFDLNDIKLLQSYYKIYSLIKATYENNKKEVYRLTSDNIKLRKLLLKFKSTPEILKNHNKLNLFINLMWREYAAIIINILADKEKETELEYIINFVREKNPSYSEFFNLNIKILNDIAHGTFKIESYPKLTNFLLKLVDKNIANLKKNNNKED